MNVDRFAEKFFSQSSYVYAGNMPVVAVDVNGDSTFVTKNDNGTYSVIGGNTKGDHNGIFIKNDDGSIGEMIGYSVTPQSFYCSDCASENKWMGTIDPSDETGKDFLNTNFNSAMPSMITYMVNATGGKKYDFKRTGGGGEILHDSEEEFYRGMPLMGKVNNQRVFGSARDVGNIAAGMVAGYNGLTWSEARSGFDALESMQQGQFTSETSSTQYAQKIGHTIGDGMLDGYNAERNKGEVYRFNRFPTEVPKQAKAMLAKNYNNGFVIKTFY